MLTLPSFLRLSFRGQSGDSRKQFVRHSADARARTTVAKYEDMAIACRRSGVKEQVHRVLRPHQLNISLRFQPVRGSSDAILFEWLKVSSLLSLKEAVLLPCRAFWSPVAYRVLGRSSEECRRVCEESLIALNAQVEVVKTQLQHLGMEEEGCPDEKTPL
ncbi:MAG: hypothetical protein SVX43_08815 [Cyanobacteriota bacterium]|nr:hypothetical protein [Cyanobacteriota bacterium]